MEQFETRFKQVEVLPLVKYFMNELDLFNLFTKYVPAAAGSFADHAESLCILTANIICDNKPLYKVQEWLSQGNRIWKLAGQDFQKVLSIPSSPQSP